MAERKKLPASRAPGKRVLLYFADRAVVERLDAMAAREGLTRSAMVARLESTIASLRAKVCRLEGILAAAADFDPEQSRFDSTITPRTSLAMRACELALSEGRAILARKDNPND